jgi:hypothetical protein
MPSKSGKLGWEVRLFSFEWLDLEQCYRNNWMSIILAR